MKNTFSTLVVSLAFGLGTTLASGQIKLNRLSTSRVGDPAEIFNQSAAEIVKFDPVTQRMFVVNGATDSIDIFDVSIPQSPAFFRSVDLSTFGNPNSVDVDPRKSADEVAVAVGAPSANQRGRVVFLTTDGDVVDSVEVGYLPDMLVYDPSGKYLIVANEGEPSPDYTFDPEGSVSIIESKTNGKPRKVKEVRFNNLKLADIPGVRISGPNGTSIAEDLEPEFIAIDPDGRTAFVSCQENNAIAKIDIKGSKLVGVFGLGAINHADLGNALDVSDRDDMINIANWPVRGLPMPDGIAVYSAKTTDEQRRSYTGNFIVTANEGDAREYGDYLDQTRVRDLTLDPSAFPLGDILKQDGNLGRLAIINTEGDIGNDGDYEQLYSFGTRSFSIFSEEGELIFDSGEMMESWIATNIPEGFNTTNSESDSEDSRSGAKGPEPEAIEIGTINKKTYAFVGLERVGGVMIFDITDPRVVSFVSYTNDRDFDVNFDENNLSNVALAGDLGPEGIDFVPADSSPTGRPLLIVANEISGTTTIYSISESN